VPRTAAIVFLTLIVGVAFFHPPEWNQNARLAAAAAFVEPDTPFTGTFRIDQLKDGRFKTEDWAKSQGAYYSNKAPGVSLLAAAAYWPLYHAERAFGADPTTIPMTATNAYLLNLWVSVFWNVAAGVALMRKLPRLRLFSRDGATIVTLVYLFATLVLPFGCAEWGHSTSAAFLTLGTLEVFDAAPRAWIAGLWLGMAALTEYLAAVSLAIAGILVLLRSDRASRWWRFGAGALPPVLLLLVYQKLCFDSYFTPAASMSNPNFLQSTRIAGLFGMPDPAALAQIFFGGGRGFIYQTPILLMAIPGAVWMYRAARRDLVILATANIVLYAVAVGSMFAWDGGLTTSMRYMIVTLPFFCLLLPEPRSIASRLAFVALFAVSAANMFALSATSTMYPSSHPLSEFAYRDLWHGNAAFNPIFTNIGITGRAPLFAIVLIYGLALTWLVVITLRRLQPAPATFETRG
jgi:hypothetical protein